MEQYHRLLCDKIIAARNQRNLCEPRISVLFDPVRTARSSDSALDNYWILALYK